jgi:hypothetical protein
MAKTAISIRIRDKTARGHRLAVHVASSLLRQQAAILEKVTDRDYFASVCVCSSF